MMKNILNINERISYLIENQYNDNQKKFAESIGYSAQVIFNIVSGRKTKPSYEVLNAILSTNVYINSEWLLTGNGEMLKSEVSQPPEIAVSGGLLQEKITFLQEKVLLLQENGLLKDKVIALNDKVIDGLEFKVTTLEKQLVNDSSTAALAPVKSRTLAGV